MKKLFKKLALMVVALLTFSVGSNYTVKEVKAATEKMTYTFSNYTAGVQYADNEIHKLDDFLTIKTTDCHFTTQLRIYSSKQYNGYAILESTKPITGISFNMGYKKDSLLVLGSNDGVSYSSISTISTTSTNYLDYTVSESFNYSFIKLDVSGSSQIRIASITVTYDLGDTVDDDTNVSMALDAATKQFKSFYSDNEVISLATEYEEYGSARISYSFVTDSEIKVFNYSNDKLTISPTSSLCNASVKITASLGSVTKTSDNINLYSYIKDSKITIAEAIEIGSLMDSDQYTNDKFFIDVKFESIDSTNDNALKYGNLYVSDNTGSLYVYGLYNEDGSIRFDKMDPQPVVGDDMTLYGVLGRYNSTSQMKNAWMVKYTCNTTDAEFLAMESTDTQLSYDYCYEYNQETAIARESNTVSLSFSSTSSRVSWDSDSQKWSNDGITFINEKSASKDDVIDSSNPVRCYANSKITLTYSVDNSLTNTKIDKVVFNAANASYATALYNSKKELFTVSNTAVTVDYSDSNLSTLNLVVEKLSAQVRLNSIDIFYSYEVGGEETVDVLTSESYSNFKMRFGAKVPSNLYESVEPTAAGVLVIPNSYLVTAEVESIKDVLDVTEDTDIASFVANAKDLDIPFANISCTPNKVESTYEVAADLNILETVTALNVSRLWTELTAVVYFETTDGIILLQETTYSVESMVDKYIQKVNSSELSLTEDLVYSLDMLDKYISAEKAKIAEA